jgi:hypothetical protein
VCGKRKEAWVEGAPDIAELLPKCDPARPILSLSWSLSAGVADDNSSFGARLARDRAFRRKPAHVGGIDTRPAMLRKNLFLVIPGYQPQPVATLVRHEGLW